MLFVEISILEHDMLLMLMQNLLSVVGVCDETKWFYPHVFKLTPSMLFYKLEYFGALHQKVWLLQRAVRWPSASLGGLQPLFWGLWLLWEAYGLYQNHQWISQFEYILFDTQHVEICSKMAEIAKIVWNCVKIAWNCMRECMKYMNVSSLNFSAWLHEFWYPTC